MAGSRSSEPKERPRHNRWVASLPLRWRFYASGLYLSPLAPLALGFAAGVMTVLLGIGGGFILVPAMIYLLGMAPRVVVGTSLVMILAVSAVTTMVHAMTTQAVDIVLAALLLVGGVIGAQYGAILATTAEARPARMALAGDHPDGRAANAAGPDLAARRDLHDRVSVRRALILLGLAPLLLAQAEPQAGAGHQRPVDRDPIQLHRRAAAAVRCDPLSRRPRAAKAGRRHRRAEGPGRADPGPREAEDRRHLDERRFQPFPLGAQLLRGRIVGAGPPAGR